MKAIVRSKDLKNTIVGKKLRSLRELHKKSLHTVAMETKMPYKTLLKIENGEIKIRDLTAAKLCQYYRCKLEDIIE